MALVALVALVLRRFVLNPHRRPPYSTFPFCITRYATDEFLGQRNRPAKSSRLDLDGLDERGHLRNQKPLNERERSGRCGAPQCPQSRSQKAVQGKPTRIRRAAPSYLPTRPGSDNPPLLIWGPILGGEYRSTEPLLSSSSPAWRVPPRGFERTHVAQCTRDFVPNCMCGSRHQKINVQLKQRGSTSESSEKNFSAHRSDRSFRFGQSG